MVRMPFVQRLSFAAKGMPQRDETSFPFAKSSSARFASARAFSSQTVIYAPISLLIFSRNARVSSTDEYSFLLSAFACSKRERLKKLFIYRPRFPLRYALPRYIRFCFAGLEKAGFLCQEMRRRYRSAIPFRYESLKQIYIARSF